MFENTAAGFDALDVSLECAREMRAAFDSVTSSKSYGAKQGVLGPQWQRQELRAPIYSEMG